MSQGIVTVAYIGAIIMFILALSGLSQPETSRRGNFYGILGMLMALLATIIGIVSDNYFILFFGVIIGGGTGLVLAKKVAMTQMPELVAILHSLVGWRQCWSALPTSWAMTPVWPVLIKQFMI